MKCKEKVMGEYENILPKKIWILWYQGASNAPFIVNKCIDSWIINNPTWDIIVLDKNNLSDYIDLDIPAETLENLSLQHQSDLVRALLLSKHGGIWADATTFCRIPLDSWINDYMESGFFAFEKPGIDRVISNWFIASNKNSPVCTKLFKILRAYWIEHNFKKPNKVQKKITKKISKCLNRSERTTKYWFHPIFSKVLKIYPYYIFHYIFKQLVCEDNECKTIWEKTKRLSAEEPLSIVRGGLFSSLSPSTKKLIDDSTIPLFKLHWQNYDDDKYCKNTILYYLFEEGRGNIQ